MSHLEAPKQGDVSVLKGLLSKNLFLLSKKLIALAGKVIVFTPYLKSYPLYMCLGMLRRVLLCKV